MNEQIRLVRANWAVSTACGECIDAHIARTQFGQIMDLATKQ